MQKKISLIITALTVISIVVSLFGAIPVAAEEKALPTSRGEVGLLCHAGGNCDQYCLYPASSGTYKLYLLTGAAEYYFGEQYFYSRYEQCYPWPINDPTYGAGLSQRLYDGNQHQFKAVKKYNSYYTYTSGLFGPCEPPEYVELASFSTSPAQGGILVTWQTASEINNLGFNLYRTEENNYESPSRIKLNEALIPSQSPGGIVGATYMYLDATALEGVTYYYWLEDIEADGDSRAMGVHGAVSGQWNKPKTGAVSPNSGGQSYTKAQAFTATFSDADGDLGIVSLKFSEAVVVSYNLAAKKAKVTGGAVLKKCSVSGDGGQLTVTWKLKFPKALRGQYDLYMSAQDGPGNRAGWTLAGTWSVQ